MPLVDVVCSKCGETSELLVQRGMISSAPLAAAKRLRSNSAPRRLAELAPFPSAQRVARQTPAMRPRVLSAPLVSIHSLLNFCAFANRTGESETFNSSQVNDCD